MRERECERERQGERESGWVPGTGLGDVRPSPPSLLEAVPAATVVDDAGGATPPPPAPLEEGILLFCRETPTAATGQNIEGRTDLEPAGVWSLRCFGAGESRAACGGAGRFLCRGRSGDVTDAIRAAWLPAAATTVGEGGSGEGGRGGGESAKGGAGGAVERSWVYRRDAAGECRHPAAAVIAMMVSRRKYAGVVRAAGTLSGLS